MSHESSETETRDEASAGGGEAGGEATANKAPRAAHDALGMARPRFLLDFPEDANLEPLIAAFERGDYAYVREHAERVGRETDREDVREAALELRRRIDPDPLVKYLFVASIFLLLFLIAWTYLGSTAPAPPSGFGPQPKTVISSNEIGYQSAEQVKCRRNHGRS
jgi:hypothetical protein